MSEITKLRKSGALQEAYRIGLEVLRREPGNFKAKVEFGWVLNDMMKLKLESGQSSLFQLGKEYIGLIDQFIDLKIPESERTLINSVSWQIIKFVNNLANSRNPDIYLINSIISKLRLIPYDKPSGQHSLLLHAILKLNMQPVSFLYFINWWGLDNFGVEDLKPYRVSSSEGGRGYTINSLAERALCEVLKYIVEFMNSYQGDEIKDKKIYQVIKSLYHKVEEVSAKHPEFFQLRYQFVKFHLSVSRFKNRFDIRPLGRDKLLEILLPFARIKKDEFWVWDMLSELVSDEEMRLSCLCRAMMSKVEDKYLVNVKEKLAEHLIKRKLYKEAKIEISQIIKIREQNGWSIPETVKRMTSESWYKGTKINMNESNRRFYAENARGAEEILFLDLKSYVAVIKGLDESKGIAHFVFGERGGGKELVFEGSFNYKRYNLEIGVGDFVEIRVSYEDVFSQGMDRAVKQSSLGRVKVYFAKKTDKVPPSFIYKEVEDYIVVKKDKKGNMIGFVDDVFIPPDLMKENKSIKRGEKYKVYAVLNYNESKEAWSWIGLRIEK